MAIPATPLKLPRFPWIGKRPFYGWAIVAVGSVIQFMQGISSQGFATYLSPLQREFGWSKAVLAGPRSVSQVENSILGPIEGFLVDRLGPRFVVTIGVFLLGLGHILFGLTHSVWMYYLANIVITIGTGFQGLLVLSVAINHWFRRKRTIALSVMGLGYALAGVVGIPTLVFIQTSMGWRTSTIGTGLLVWAVGLPLAMLLCRSPEPYGLLPDGGIPVASSTTDPQSHYAGTEFDFTLREALHTRAFWLLSIGNALGNLGMVVVQVHLFLHLDQGVGLSQTTAAFVWSIASISNMPTRLVGGFFGDRLPKKLILASAIVILAASMFILSLTTSLQMALVFAVLYGIGWGVRTTVINAIQGEYFGRKSLGMIGGWLQSVSIPLTMAAPVVVGYMADLQGSYRSSFIITSLVILVGAALIFLATPPKHPRHKE